ncbi:hypothetical protein D6856_14830 [Butyrivibrio sp. XB500-5]|uniref:hypothetical protein n=1 Tax=Butyrivibrio sp. XB500-5 TaxID=2364880 RepID=UPI000EAA883E|nr:hypothetical protein [Butyrivibrio sp. XB500-5]RKM56073.1 hypothetical protein D6856_14830 [Butyrivibrio sp. XB500-5]
MKNLKKSLIVGILIFATLTLNGCGKKVESWAYNHEPDKEILALYDNGNAVFKNEKYKYIKDDKFITLTAKDGNEFKMHYDTDNEGIVLYEIEKYTACEGTDANGNSIDFSEEDKQGIVGYWLHENGNSSFVFSNDGRFMEDNSFGGQYAVDEASGQIKLMYDADFRFQDAFLYYSVNGDTLTIEYPWPMVHTTGK